MKNFKKSVTILLALSIILLFSSGILAEDSSGLSEEEQAMMEATAMVVDEENNTITYISPDETNDEDVNVFEKFDDVPEDAWYEGYLSHLVQLGIINGMSDDKFAPNDYVTRAQFATMLAYASDADLTQYEGVTSFSDVSVWAWYAPQVEWAYQEGLINGRGDGLFCPESYITREETAVLIDRYAESEDSCIFEDNQYELADNADEYLSDEEIEVLEALLADPVYEDEEDISSWAEEDVDEMSVAGIFSGDEENEFNPQDPLRRSECVKIISAYIINDTKPTFYFPGGSYIEYIDIEDDTEDTASTEDGADVDMGVIDSFNDNCNPLDLETLLGNSGNNDSGNITINWAQNTHQDITAYAIQKVRSDRRYITDKMESEMFTYHYDYDSDGNSENRYINGAQAIWVYSYYTDLMSIENQNGAYYSHFYEPGVGSYNSNNRDTNAYEYFNDHFYNAYTNYRNGYKETSYKEMGMCIHYLEDMCNPYHASNHTNSNTNGLHGEYESWVDKKMVAENYATYESVLGQDITSSYHFMYDNTFIYMANSLAGSAKSQYNTCSSFKTSPTAALNATKNQITSAERAVAGIINRYYFYGYLNH